MPLTRTPHHARPWRRWRGRLTAVGLAAAAVLAGMLPAHAGNGTIWTTLSSMPTARGSAASAAAPCPPGQTGTCVYSMGGGTTLATVATAESYNRLTNAWSTLPPLPTRRSNAAAVAATCPPGQTGTCVYVIGGGIFEPTAFTPQTAVESYNPVTNAWSTVAPLRTARTSLAAAAAPCPTGQTGTCVYAFGGESNSMLLNLAEVYNPANNTWSTLTAMPTRRGYLSGAAAACPPGQTGTCVYAVGGFGAGILGAVESYNPATNAWSPAASLPTPRTGAATTATTCPPGQTGTCLYTVGGQGGVNGPPLGSVQSYNPVSNLWTELPPLPTPRFGLTAAATVCPVGVAGNCVYAIGGSTGISDVRATLEALDPPDPSTF
ncbi:Kelch repeat-containing protein [Streptomyces wedmorensis]|uniref:Kelch repeat-containing protein n=1 Tax=Streptomyces wedmorensis TaxID=43759 RepID=UPI0037A38A01